RSHAKAVDTLGPLVDHINQEGESSEFIDALIMLGRSNQSLGKFQEAEVAMSRYLALRPKGEQADQALATRAIAHARLGQDGQTESDLRSLMIEHAGSPLIGPTAQELAELAYARKDWAGASKLFAVMIGQDPKTKLHAAGLSGRAWSYYQQKNFAEAAADFSKLIADHPEDSLAPEANYMQGECLKDSGQAEEAVRVLTLAFNKYAPAEPSNAKLNDKEPAKFAYLAGLSAARILRTQKKNAEADAAYEKVTSRFPKADQLDQVLNEWALFNGDLQNFPRSDEIYRRLVKDFPESTFADNALLSLGESELEAGKLDVASKAFRELLARPGADEKVREASLFHLCGIGVEQRKWKEVIADAGSFATVFPQSPRRAELEFYLAEGHVHENQFDGARALLEKLKTEVGEKLDAKSPPWQPRIWVLLAETFLQLKRYDDVVATVEDLRKRDSKSPWLYQADEVLGRAYKNQAKFDEARAAFQRVIDDSTGQKTETAAKSQFLAAETYMLQKNYKEAQEAYLRVYHLYKFPDWQAPALFQAAACDEMLNQWPSAVKTYEDLIREFANHEFAAKAKPRLDVARTKAAG
ncbi:MAG: tetratricopeptide repeat protein, partial [Planctomycetaceae bacterium]